MAPPSPLSDAQRLAWLRLWRSENVGPVTFRQLLRRFGSAEAALDALPELARRGGRDRPLAICSAPTAERELAQLGRMGARLIAMADPGFPPLLAELDDAPPLLSALGRATLLPARSSTRPRAETSGGASSSSASKLGKAGSAMVIR